MEWFFNGPNFFGSKAELKEILKGVDKEKINKLGANQGTILHRPLGQHLQGLFKNMVKSFKASSQWNSQICRHGRWGTSHSFYRSWKLIEFLTANMSGYWYQGQHITHYRSLPIWANGSPQLFQRCKWGKEVQDLKESHFVPLELMDILKL